MDSKFYWILNNLVALVQLTDHEEKYRFFSINFSKKELGISRAKDLARDLGVEDRIEYSESAAGRWVMFDYHGVKIFDLMDKKEESNEIV